jgi:hypothetical protein
LSSHNVTIRPPVKKGEQAKVQIGFIIFFLLAPIVKSSKNQAQAEEVGSRELEEPHGGKFQLSKIMSCFCQKFTELSQQLVALMYVISPIGHWSLAHAMASKNLVSF